MEQLVILFPTVRLLDPLVFYLHREIAVGIPDVEARKLILEVMSKGVKIEEDVRFDELARLTPGKGRRTRRYYTTGLV